jgi:transcriptional regulator with XRE-family HTH domain
MTPQVGQVLREARTERGIALSEVERVTKIRVRFLQAMEEDRWEALPAPTYARSFLARYARFLGLDERPLVDQYRETVGEDERAEPVPQGVIRPGALRQSHPTSRVRSIDLKAAGMVLAGLVVLVLLGLIVVGSIGNSDNGPSVPHHHAPKGAGSPAATTTGQQATTATSPPATGQVSLELRSIEDVWVCLVDDRGRALVNGETLTPGEGRGPFESPGFEVTFGNGSVEMTVDGQPAKIPPVAEPLGYRISASGVRRLGPSAQPTCV